VAHFAGRFAFGRLGALVCAVALVLSMASVTQAATVLTTLSIESTGVVTAGGQDTNYIYEYSATDPSVTPGIVSGGQAYVVDSSGWPIVGGGWNTNSGWAGSPNAQWIAPGPTYQSPIPSTGLLTATAGYYTYQTSFNIPVAFDPTTVVFSGSLSSDNCTLALGVNGVAVTQVSGSGPLMVPGTCLSQSHTFAVGGSLGALSTLAGLDPTYLATTTLHAGTNTIQFVVQNLSIPSGPNPTGLVVWMQAQGMATPEPSTWGLLVAGLGAVAWLRRRNRRPI
jgi:PEP-CTERM motif